MGGAALRRRGAPRGLRIQAVALGALVVLAVLLIGLHVRAYPTLSPVDELHHVDYLIKASHGQLLRRGDVIGPETVREGACRGVDAVGFAPGNCDDPSWLSGREFNTEEIQPPAYYFLTGVTARVLRPFMGTGSIVAASRMVGALWLSGGVVVVWLAMALLAVPLGARVAALALMLSTPVVLHASATVTDDATALVAGGLVLFTVLAWEMRRAPVGVVLLAVFVGVSLRLTNFTGAGAVILYLLIRAFAAGPGEEGIAAEPGGARARSRRSLLLTAAAVGATVVVTGLIWVALNSAVARVGPLANPNTRSQQASDVGFGTALGQVDAAVTPVRKPYLPPFVRTAAIGFAVQLTDWSFLGALIGVAALASRGSRPVALAAAALAAAAATGPVLVASNYLFQGAFYGIPPRYGLSLLPVMTVVLALSLEKRWVRRSVATLAALIVCLILAAELG